MHPDTAANFLKELVYIAGRSAVNFSSKEIAEPYDSGNYLQGISCTLSDNDTTVTRILTDAQQVHAIVQKHKAKKPNLLVVTILRSKDAPSYSAIKSVLDLTTQVSNQCVVALNAEKANPR